MTFRMIVTAALLAVGPLTAMGQESTLPSVGSAKGATAVKDAGSKNVPGATGKTVVAGSKSTVADDRPATNQAKTNTASGGGK